MKRFKKILGVFMALAMVVGSLGLMPRIEAKAAYGIELSAATVEQDGVATFKVNDIATLTGSGAITTRYIIFPVGTAVSNVTASTGTVYTSGDITIPTDVVGIVNIQVASFDDDGLVGGRQNSSITVTAKSNSGGGTGVGSGRDVTVGSVSYDPYSSLLRIVDDSANASKVAYVGLAKTATPTDADIAKIKFDAFLIDGTLNININSVSPKKAAYYVIYTDDCAKPVVFTIKENAPKLKVVIDYSKDLLEDAIKVDGTTLANLEVRVPNGVWESVIGDSAFNSGDTNTAGKVLVDKAYIEELAAYGATLEFRVAGKEKDTTDAQFPSAAVKTKIAKSAAGPKVAVDGAKQTIKYGKGIEVLSTTGWVALTAAGATVDMNTLESTATAAEKLFGTMDTGIGGIVRTIATDKKPASKVATVALAGRLTSAQVETALGLDDADPSNDVLKVTLTANPNGTTKEITFKNETGKVIQFCVSTDATAPTLSTTKWTTVAVSGVGKVAKAAAVANAKIYIRYASVKDPVTKISSLASASVSIDCPVWVLTATTTTTTTTDTTTDTTTTTP